MRDAATGTFRSPSFVEAVELFWSKVEIKDDSECWPWQAGISSRKYGQFRVHGLEFSSGFAHRWSFYFNRGRVPIGEVRHTCDNPICVNPAHLIEGTHLQNEQDKDERGRRPVGVQGFLCKKCGGPREGRSKRGNGHEFAFCVPCQRARLADYYSRRKAAASLSPGLISSN